MLSSHLKYFAVLTLLLTALSVGLQSLVDHLRMSVDGVGLILLASLITVSVLYYYSRNSVHSGWRLVLLVCTMAFGIGYANNLVEAYIFGVTDAPTTLMLLGKGLIVNSLLAPAVVYVAGRWYPSNREQTFLSPVFAPRSVGSWLWRIVVSDGLYLILYIGAGLLLQQLYPDFMNFYAGKIPPISLMIQTQLFGRGLFFTGMAVLIARTMNQSVWHRALFIGAAFSVLGGIAPLLGPNEAMPGYVRLGHGFEVGFSNFLYGLLIGRVLGQRIPQPTITRNVITQNKPAL